MADPWARRRRVGMAAGGAGAALAVVVLGAHAVPAGRTASPRLTSLGVVGDVAGVVGIALGVLSLALLVDALWPRRGERSRRPAPARSWWRLALDLLVPLLAVGLVAAIVTLESGSGRRAPLQRVAGIGRAARATGRNGSHVALGSAGVVLPVAATLLAVVLAGSLAALARRRVARRRAEDLAPQPAPEPTLPAAAARALGELGAETDPRRAILRAYRALEEGTVRADARRVPSEAPSEFRDRLVAAGAPADPAARLTELFELARFSDHAVERGQRDEAVAALEALRARGGGGA